MRLLTLCCAITAFTPVFFSCKKDIDKEIPPPDPGEFIVDTREVQIVLPPGSTFDLSGSKVVSPATLSQVDASGKARVADLKEDHYIAYLIDKDNKLVMASL